MQAGLVILIFVGLCICIGIGAASKDKNKSTSYGSSSYQSSFPQPSSYQPSIPQPQRLQIRTVNYDSFCLKCGRLVRAGKRCLSYHS